MEKDEMEVRTPTEFDNAPENQDAHDDAQLVLDRLHSKDLGTIGNVIQTARELRGDMQERIEKAMEELGLPE